MTELNLLPPLKQTGEILVSSIKETLKLFRKVATRKTIRSVRYEVEIGNGKATVTVWAEKSYQYILSGRRKGAKRPVRKVGNKFVLVQELLEWTKAVNYTGSHYLLAKGISERGIKGVPITKIALGKVEKEVIEIITKYVSEGLAKGAADSFREQFKDLT